jgi:hypothetical protein
MAELNTLPQVIDIDAYGGDTLTIHIKADITVIAGREFTATVRLDTADATVDATFTTQVTAEGADISLAAADSGRLSKDGLYEGVWDVQLAPAGGGDPVTTLGYGALRIHPDVTRALP